MHIKKNFSVWLLILVPLTVALAQSEDKGPIIWKAVSVYPKDIPVFHNGIEKFAEELKSISKGQLIIEVFGAGEFKYKDKNIGPNDVFEAVSGGKVEIGYGAPTYWSDNAPGCDFMFAVPFGLNAQGMYEWLYRGEGLELMTEFFGKQNLIPFPIGNTGGAMAGWFDKEIMSVEDFKGMKIRMLGITQKYTKDWGLK